jgi:hypothetical protein
LSEVARFWGIPLYAQTIKFRTGDAIAVRQNRPNSQTDPPPFSVMSGFISLAALSPAQKLPKFFL